MPEEILSYLDADYGIVGEGETAVCSLVSALEQQADPCRRSPTIVMSVCLKKGMP